MKNFPFLKSLTFAVIPCLLLSTTGCGAGSPILATIDKEDPSSPIMVKSRHGPYPLDPSSEVIIETSEESFIRFSSWALVEGHLLQGSGYTYGSLDAANVGGKNGSPFEGSVAISNVVSFYAPGDDVIGSLISPLIFAAAAVGLMYLGAQGYKP